MVYRIVHSILTRIWCGLRSCTVKLLSLDFYGTGKLRYLEFQGNGENTSSFPKFEIANYDITRIHVHEQKCVHFRHDFFVKSALLQNICMLVNCCVLPTLFTHKYRGQIMGAVSTTDKTFVPFSGFLPEKDTSAARL